MRTIFLCITILLVSILQSQTPITPNPLQYLDRLIVDGVEIGENISSLFKKFDDKRIMSYVAYLPAFTFGNDFKRFDLLTDGSYGKLSIKDNDLKNVFTWDPKVIYHDQGIRILGCWSLDHEQDKITAIVGATYIDSNELLMGVLTFDTTLQLLSNRWFTDPNYTDFRYHFDIFKNKEKNYFRYGRDLSSMETLSEFDTLGNQLNTYVLGYTGRNAFGGTYMPNGELVLNPGYILDTSYQVQAKYNMNDETNRRMKLHVVPLDDKRFIYAPSGILNTPTKKLSYQQINVCDLQGNEKVIFYQEQDNTLKDPKFTVSAAGKGLEASDSTQIIFAYGSGLLLNSNSTKPPAPVDVTVKSIHINGSVNWTRTLGGDAHYVPVNILRVDNSRYHLIVAKFYDIAWIDPGDNTIFPKIDLMYVTFDTLGNVIGTSSFGETEDEQKLNIYPNPTNHHIFIDDFGQNNEMYLELFDLTGKLVLSQEVSQKQCSLEGISNGIYLYRVLNSKKRQIHEGKIVIEK
jgi:Secretion system C-terminal sorting domain